MVQIVRCALWDRVPRPLNLNVRCLREKLCRPSPIHLNRLTTPLSLHLSVRILITVTVKSQIVWLSLLLSNPVIWALSLPEKAWVLRFHTGQTLSQLKTGRPILNTSKLKDREKNNGIPRTRCEYPRLSVITVSNKALKPLISFAGTAYRGPLA